MTEANRPKTSKRRHAIVVAGMHRSGTSALAGVLHRPGAELPATPLPPNENNPDGYAESRVIC
ncbi:MAG: sulfotransferase family protein, partial [bacterium]|nr:sulfotransferase family protein [bacterium]